MRSFPCRGEDGLALVVYSAEPGSAGEDSLKLLASWSAKGRLTGKYLSGHAGRATEAARPYTSVGSDDIVRDVVAIAHEIGCSPRRGPSPGAPAARPGHSR